MKISSLVLALVATVLFSACGGGGGSSDDVTPVTNEPAETGVTNTQESARTTLVTAAPILTDTSVSSAINATSSAMAPQLRNIIATTLTRDLLSETRDCLVSGTMNFSLTSTSSASITYNNCDMGDGNVMNGNVTFNNMQLSGNDLTSATVTLDMTTTSNTDTNTIDATMDFESDSSDGFITTMNGTIDTVASAYSTHASYTNYKVTTTASSTSIDGTVTISNTPNLCNGNGTYVITTTSAMTFSDYGTITSGEVNINGNNYVFHSNDTVTITAADGSSETVEQAELATCGSTDTGSETSSQSSSTPNASQSTAYSCTQTQSALNMTMTTESNYDGVVAFDCNLYMYSLEGVSSLAIANITTTETASGVDGDGYTFEYTLSKNAAAGTVHNSGSHAKYGNFDCQDTYETAFPITVDESSIPTIDDIVPYWEEGATQTATTCPDWLSDGDDSGFPQNVDTTITHTVTDTSGASHQIVIHQVLQ